MRRLILLFSFAALLLPATWTNVQAQGGGNVEIRNFTAFVHPLRKIVRVIWWASEDSAFVNQILEHSLDGDTFAPIAEITPLLTGEDGHIYEYWHVTAPLGSNYYRLRLIFADGGERLEEPVKVEVGAPPIYTYPTLPSSPRPGATPLTDGQDDGVWTEAIITDLFGRPVLSVNGGPSEFTTSELPMGIYVLNAKYASGWKATTLMISRQ